MKKARDISKMMISGISAHTFNNKNKLERSSLEAKKTRVGKNILSKIAKSKKEWSIHNSKNNQSRNQFRKEEKLWVSNYEFWSVSK